jgi:transketolase
VAWAQALRRRDGPAALALSRQAVPPAARADQAAAIARGGYVLADPADGAEPRAVLIGTGSELQLALRAQALLAGQGVPVRVVSMPCTTVFDRQDAAWREAVLPRRLPAVAVEAAHPAFWRAYVGLDGEVVGIASFGESAPAPALYAHFGLTAEAVAAAVQRVLSR